MSALSRPLRILLATAIFSIQPVLIVAGAEVHDDDHGHHDDDDNENVGASFETGQGLLLGDEAKQQIGLQVASVEEMIHPVRFTANARVYETAHAHMPGEGQRSDHDSHAVAIVQTGQANLLKPGQSVEVKTGDGKTVKGRLVRVDTETTKAIGQAEAIIDLPDPDHRIEFGSFAKATFNCGDRRATAIPRSALLETAGGTFVYVLHDDRFLRTSVRPGVSSEDFVEIAEGLQEGDAVVSKGAIDLWLIELRFTKGGGHSH
jgi:multidrug efflux pump subunit AcrA (membrane-fusion protein)